MEFLLPYSLSFFVVSLLIFPIRGLMRVIELFNFHMKISHPLIPSLPTRTADLALHATAFMGRPVFGITFRVKGCLHIGMVHSRKGGSSLRFYASSPARARRTTYIRLGKCRIIPQIVLIHDVAVQSPDLLNQVLRRSGDA